MGPGPTKTIWGQHLALRQDPGWTPAASCLWPFLIIFYPTTHMQTNKQSKFSRFIQYGLRSQSV